MGIEDIVLGEVFQGKGTERTRGSRSHLPPQHHDKKEEPDITSLPPLGKPLYIQSFMPSSEQIMSRSVLEIVTPDDLNSNKLGVSAWEESCLTCDGFLEECCGHEGHMKIPIPIYRIFFVKRLIQILNCVCFYCQRLRMPKTDQRYEWIRNLPFKKRLEFLEKYSRPYKYCGQQPKEGVVSSFKDEGEEEDESVEEGSLDTITEEGGQEYKDCACSEIRGPCHKMHINFKNEDRDSTFIRAVIRLEAADLIVHRQDPTWRPFTVGPQDIFDCLSLLDEETLHMLGCNHWNLPKSHMWDVLPVPSLNTRPCHTFAGIGSGKKRIFNDWTKFLRNIVMARNELEEMMKLTDEKLTCCHYIFNEIESKNFAVCFRYGYLDKKAREEVKKRLKPELKSQKNMGALETAWRNLMKHVAAFHSHRHKKFIQKGSYGKPLVNIEERYKYQKFGRFRGNVIARRVNNAGRGVLEGDMSLEVNQVGIPKKEAMNLTRKIYVNRFNLHVVQKWILNGPFQYPGANYVTMKTGEEIHLAFYENRRDLDPSQILYVRRHLLDGDVALVGRQPTLHRGSMMTFRIKVIPGYTVHLHYAVFPPMGADCDGDEVNFQIPQNLDAIAEAKTLSAVANNIMKDGKIWIKFIQNAVVAGYLMTDDTIHLDREEMEEMVQVLKDVWEYPEPAFIDERGKPVWLGRQVASLLFPKDFNMNLRGDEGDFVIRNGKFLKGRLNARTLNGSGGILHHLYRDYADKQVTMKFLHEGYIVFQKFLDYFGHSAGYYDCAVDFHHEEDFAQGKASLQMAEIMRKRERVKDNIQKLSRYTDRFPHHTPDSNDAAVENNIREHIDKVNSQSMQAMVQYHELVNRESGNENGILHMINSGAKGSKNVINQMCGVVGQIYVIYRRFAHTSSHFLKGQNTLASFGFLEDSYSTGVSLPGIISEAHATCESVIGKNKGTSKSGYTIRKITTCMMGVVIDHLRRAVDTNGRVIWATYGNDGYDPQCMTSCKLRLLGFKEWDVVRRYGTVFDLKELICLSQPRTKAQWNKFLDGDQDSSIDQKWFQGLQHFQHEGRTLSDQTRSLEACMQEGTLAEWRSIKGRPAILEALTSEVRDLCLLRQKVHSLLSRCHESFDLSIVRAPFSFQHLFERCQGIVPELKQVDLNPFQYREFAVAMWDKFLEEKLVAPNNLTLKSLFFDWMSTRSLMLRWKFGLEHLAWLAKEMTSILIRSLIQPGESVGIVATQNMGEPFAQMCLQTPNNQGKFLNVTGGTERIKNLVDSKFTNPQMTIVLKKSIKTKAQATMFGLSLVKCHLSDLVSSYPTYRFEGKGIDRVCLIHIPVDKTKAVRRMVSLRAVAKTICNRSNLTLDQFRISFMDEPELFLDLRLPLKMAFWNTVAHGLGLKKVSESLVAANIVFNLTQKLVIHGRTKVENFVTEEITINTPTGKSKRWSVSTLGSDLAHVLRLPEVDSRRTVSNDVGEMCDVLGMHAARKSLENEFLFVMSDMADARHIKLISRMMASDLVIKGMKIRQVAQNIPPLQRASYEQVAKQMTLYCGAAEQDDGKTICGATLMNKFMSVGTGFNMELKSMPESEAMVPEAMQRKFDLTPNKICQYVFSPKADGVRHFLVMFHNRKGQKLVALVDRKFDVYLLSVEDLPERFFSGTILDGELVRDRLGGYVFMVFDCLMSCGNKSSVLRYDQRIEIGREVVCRLVQGLGGEGGSEESGQEEKTNRQFGVLSNQGASRSRDLKNLLKTQGFEFEMGSAEPYALPVSRFPEVSRRCYPVGKLPFQMMVKPVFDLKGIVYYTKKWMSRLPFETDGFVMTNLYEPCYPFRMRRESIFKWKPRTESHSENTVDFVVGHSPGPRDPPLDMLARHFSDHPKARNRWMWPAITIENVEKFRRQASDMPPQFVKCSLWTNLRPSKRRLPSGELQEGAASGSAEGEDDSGQLDAKERNLQENQFRFSDAVVTLPRGEELQVGQVYECIWSLKDQRWEVIRFRNKEPNKFQTVVATLQNIVEDIQLEELTLNSF